KRKERILTQMRSFGDHDLGAFPRQHPDWNFQSPAAWIHDTDCPISSLRSAKDPKSSTMKRVKGVEDLNIRIVRAQGIVGVGVITRIFIASCLVVGSRRMAKVGSLAGRGSSCRSGYCRDYSEACSCIIWRRLSPPAS